MKQLGISGDLFREIVDGPPIPPPEDCVAFDATGFAPSAWPNSLKPIGAGTVQREPFETLWEEHKKALAHLHPMIAEQWIYKHWNPTGTQKLDTFAPTLVTQAALGIEAIQKNPGNPS